jgi:hypothetical protein
VVDEKKSSGTGVEETAAPVTPAQASDQSGEDETHAEDEVEVPPVLPLDNRATVQVGDVGDTGLATGLDKHPANVGPEKALVGVVGIKFGVGVAVVRAMAARPPAD